MADGEAPENSSKTEDPSQKKLDDALKRGDVMKSQEVTTWFMLLGSTLVLALMAPWTAASLMEGFTTIFANADRYEIGGAAFATFAANLSTSVMLGALLPLLALAVFAVAANFAQHRPVLSVEPITPKLNKISPLAGFKRLFSAESLVNFLKGLVKIAVVGAVLFFVLWPERDRLDTMVTADVAMLLAIFQELSLKIFIATVAVVTVIAGLDYVYQRNKWWTRLKMTVQETRDEYKQMEGDPQVKARIRQIRAEKSRQRMMAQVPDSTVVITNPTHYAVALKYDRTMQAPKCLAKGADAVALRIRALAAEHDIPIVENPPLARALFAAVDVDETIPAEHFKAVAQVIGYVMRLREKPRWRA